MRIVIESEMSLVSGGDGQSGSGSSGSGSNSTDQTIRNMCDNQGWGDNMRVTITVSQEGSAAGLVEGGTASTESMTCGEARESTKGGG